MFLPCFKQTNKGVYFSVNAIPYSSKTEIIDLHEDRCRIKVKAPPIDGEANSALIKAIAKIFRIPKKSVILDKGSSGKKKLFLLIGIDIAEANSILTKILSEKAR